MLVPHYFPSNIGCGPQNSHAGQAVMLLPLCSSRLAVLLITNFRAKIHVNHLPSKASYQRYQCDTDSLAGMWEATLLMSKRTSKLTSGKWVKRHNSPLHLLVVLSRMALVDTILPYLPRQETGNRVNSRPYGLGVNELNHAYQSWHRGNTSTGVNTKTYSPTQQCQSSIR